MSSECETILFIAQAVPPKPYPVSIGLILIPHSNLHPTVRTHPLLCLHLTRRKVCIHHLPNLPTFSSHSVVRFPKDTTGVEVARPKASGLVRVIPRVECRRVRF